MHTNRTRSVIDSAPALFCTGSVGPVPAHLVAAHVDAALTRFGLTLPDRVAVVGLAGAAGVADPDSAGRLEPVNDRDQLVLFAVA